MSLVSSALFVLLTMMAADRPALVVNAADTPVRLDRATILTTADAPPVLLYAATNLTGDEFEVFTVTAFVFDAEGVLKARQTAPSRRTLEPRGSKYSTLVLDGSVVGPTDIVVVGVNQAQRAATEAWWRAADLEALATAAARPKKLPRPGE